MFDLTPPRYKRLYFFRFLWHWPDTPGALSVKNRRFCSCGSPDPTFIIVSCTHFDFSVSTSPSPVIWIESGPLSLDILDLFVIWIDEPESGHVYSSILEVLKIQFIHSLQTYLYNKNLLTFLRHTYDGLSRSFLTTRKSRCKK